MSCERYAAAITDYACGADIEHDARAHLDACDRCRVRYDEERLALGDLDAALSRALAIEPSPGFERAVLARIERHPSARPRLILWTALAAAAALMIIAGLAAIRSSRESVVPTPAQDVRIAPPELRRPPAPQPQPVAPPAIARTKPAPPSTPPPARVREPKPLPQPEVIVAADQAEALARYLALVRGGRIDTTSLAAPQVAIGDELPAIVVAPLAVEPLNVPDVEIVRSPSLEERGRE
jgi:hypothetical protein